MQQINNIIFFALACALGAWSRCLILEWFAGYTNITALWGVFCVNILGCLGFGLLWPLSRCKKLLLTGFMGSFTTFSSYIFEIYLFIQNKDWWLLICNSFMQIIFGLIALQIGLLIHNKVASYTSK